MSRLRQGGGEISAHPDANLLAAFSEQALASPEREQVLAHLAACADCREVVALALPPVEEQPVVEPARGGWGWRPEFMRWAVVGASAAVVVAAVFLARPELQSPQYQTAKLNVEEAKVADKVASAPMAAQETEAKSADIQKKIETTSTRQARGVASPQVAEMAPAAPPPPVTAASGSGAALGVVANTKPSAAADAGERALRIDGSDALAKESAAQPSSQLALEDRDAARARANESAVHGYNLAVTTKDEAARVEAARAEAKTEGAKNTDQAYVVLEAPKAARTMERAAAKQKADSQPMTMRAVNPNPRTWRIMDGKLQWSLDGGQTWAFVRVPGDVKVLAVDARQNSVWVGGTSGVVMRSPDNGATWAPVTSGWSGDVVYLRFNDAQRGTLRTSTHEEWVTADGGLSWKRQGP